MRRTPITPGIASVGAVCSLRRSGVVSRGAGAFCRVPPPTRPVWAWRAGGPGMLRGRRVGRELELPEAPPALRSLVLVCGGRGLRSTRRDGVGTSRVF